MTYIITNVGRDWLSEQLVDADAGEKLTEVAVGTGTSSPSGTDTELEAEVYRSDISNSNVEITTTATDGRIRASISTSGGTELTPGTEITEIGLYSNHGILFYREVFNGIIVDSGETVTFELDIDLLSG
jgi:hypothetical protein